MRVILVFLAMLLGSGSWANPIPEGYIGLDQDNDFVCQPSDMGFELTAGDQGSTFSVDVYFDMIAVEISAFGCTFCVQEKTLVAEEGFVYQTPETWVNQAMANSEENPGGVPVSEWISAAYPDRKCYAVSALDFHFNAPMIAPFYLGTFSFVFAAAEDRCVGFVIDYEQSGYWSIESNTGFFTTPEQTCPPYDCGGTTGTSVSSWGGVKSLFR